MRIRHQIKRGLLALVVVATLGAHNIAEAGALSSKLDAAEKTVIDCLKTLKGESQAQVETELGVPIEKGTWDFRGKKLPVFWYQPSGGWKLGIFFLEARVIKTSYQVLQ